MEVRTLPRSSSLSLSEKVWLENFRLNIINTTSNSSYNPIDVAKGVEGLINILGMYNLRKIDQKNINYKFTINVPLNSSSQINKEDIVNLSSSVFNTIKQFYNSSSLINKKLIFVDVINKNQNASSVDFEVTAIISNGTAPDFSGGAIDYGVGNEFANQCWRSGWGDLDSPNNTKIYIGGDCSETSNGTTTAQEIIQNAINSKIPQVISNKFGIIGSIKYVDVECINFNFNQLYSVSQSILECTGKDIDFIDDIKMSNELNYNSQRLLCTKCILNQYINSIAPQGKTLSYLNLWGNLAPTNDGNSSNVLWFGEACFGTPKVIPITNPNPDPLPGNGIVEFFSSNSINNL